MPELEHNVARAQQGDRTALEAVVAAIQDDVYALALRFLWHPEDAEDATQEILVRVVTHLGSFEGRSRFKTWVYRVTSNALLSMKKRRMERTAMSFEAFGRDLIEGISSDEPSPEDVLLVEEVKIGCTLAMLQCLDREHRIAFIVGEILEMDHREAAEVLDVPPSTFRKRLSRARGRITQFMTRHCGLVEPANACRCARRLAPAIEGGRVDPDHILFAKDSSQVERFPEVLASIRRLEDTRRAAALLRSHPTPRVRAQLAERLRKIVSPPS